MKENDESIIENKNKLIEQNNSVYENEEEITTTVQKNANLIDQQQMDQQLNLKALDNADKNRIKLSADPQIEPIAQEKQVISPYSRANFVKEINELNRKAARDLSIGRLAAKRGIREAAALLAPEGNLIVSADIEALVRDINAYCDINCTATENLDEFKGFFSRLKVRFQQYFGIGGNRSQIKKEHTLLADIFRRIQTIKEANANNPEFAPTLERLSGIEKSLREQSGMASESKETKEERYAQKGWDYQPGVHKEINGVGKKMVTSADDGGFFSDYLGSMTRTADRRNWPLFAHEPTPEDISQGMEGNCWVLAALASLKPQQIRDTMLDNGDGSVTVRFFRNKYSDEENVKSPDELREEQKKGVKDSKKENFEPVYVTVDKIVKTNGALDCLWVQVFLKAYTLFLQTQKDNEFKYKTSNKADKRIPDDTIDYGYVANGGTSSVAMAHILGVRTERIDIVNEYGASLDTGNAWEVFEEAAIRADEDDEVMAEMNYIKSHRKKADDRLNAVKTNYNNKRVTDELKAREGELKQLYIEREAAVKDNNKDRINELNNSIEQKRIEIKKIYKEHGDDLQNYDEAWCLYFAFGDMEKPIDKAYYDRTHGEMWDDWDEHNLAFRPMCQSSYSNTYERLKEAAEKNKGKKKKGIIMIGQPGGKDDPVSLPRNYSVRVDQFCRVRLFEVLQSTKTSVFLSKKNKRVDTTIAGPGDYMRMLETAEESVKNMDGAFKKAAEDAGIGNVVRDMEDQISGATRIIYEELQKTALAYIKRAKDGLGKVKGMPKKIVEGEDDFRTEKYYNLISDKLASGTSVCIGTKNFTSSGFSGFRGESTGKGVVGTHAYSVHGAKIVEGKKMLLLRNPWATYGVEYEEKNNMLESKSSEEATGGMFWIEMKHLINYMGSIYSV